MIEFLVELIGTAFVYGFFARRKAARCRKRYDRGETVSFAGLLGGACAPADVQQAARSSSLLAAKSGFWLETKWPLTPQRREIPRPEHAAQIEFPASHSRPKQWYQVPAARYMSSDGTIEIYCQRVDIDLLRRALSDHAADSDSANG